MSSTKRVNVLIYAGKGATITSVRHATWSLRRLLGANYAVLTVTAEQILKEPWQASCALLVMPGGADLGYCRALNGEGNQRIKQYVQLGGAYLGFCAGGYYGSAKCEFEVGKSKEGMEVIGDRELAFFPGICRGLALPGFVYHSEAGARAANIKPHLAAFPARSVPLPDKFHSYYNGGGVFVDAEKFTSKGVQILASYLEELAVDGGSGKAAVVYCRIGQGNVILTGPHPEFSGTNLNPNEPSGHDDYASVVSALVADEKPREEFMKACLTKLGLQVSQTSEAVPSLSLLHLSSAQPSLVAELVHAWHEAGLVENDEAGRPKIVGENDTFVLSQPGQLDMRTVSDALPTSIELHPKSAQADASGADSLLDYDAVPKHLLPHEDGLPDFRETPHFNHQAFFANISLYNARQSDSVGDFGKMILYGEVVTSTNTMLEKNPTWLSHMPIGLTATATTQIAGRGRGTNVWVSPPGSLMFSTVLRHSLSLSNTAPVVFVQYLAALAVVAGIRNYDGGGYERLPVKLKWPNDIYALDPIFPESEKKYVKIGGILVNSSYAGGDYTLVCGIGLNVRNAAPTTSLSQLAEKLNLPPFTLEKLLASILSQFEALYTRFCRTGFDETFQNLYYSLWLHTDQIVTLETEGGARARIKGITTDWGLLVAEELGWQDRPTGRRFQLQSDSNSFDFFKGLLKRKI